MAGRLDNYAGRRLSYDGALCTVRYVGEVAGTSGTWLGVEWDDGSRGKHDGVHRGKRYFDCLSRAPAPASFVRPSRPADRPLSFLEALHEKYAGGSGDGAGAGGAIEISGKVVEEVGFDKIERRLARLQELRIVILDGFRIHGGGDEDAGRGVRGTCPRIVELDVSRNLWERWEDVVAVCEGLGELRSLRASGNRFRELADEGGESRRQGAFDRVTDLALEETLLTWPEICSLATDFPSLRTLNVGTNQLTTLPLVELRSLSSSLTTLNLEFNDIESLSDLASLSALTSLANLHLKGNNISSLSKAPAPPPAFPASLRYVDVSYNQIASWSFVDALPTLLPGLTGLRIAHNPIYDNPNSDAEDPSGTAAAGEVQAGPGTTDEAFMVTIGRLAGIRTLNFVTISANDRSNAEMFYLSRIAKQISSAPESSARQIAERHPRYEQLCGLYGEPDIVRRDEVNPEFLEARLVDVHFHLAAGDGGGDGAEAVRRRSIPKSFDIYSVRSVAGRLFGLSPLRVRLVWETGEWDPVANWDRVGEGSGGEDDSRDDDDDEEEEERGAAEGTRERGGKWVSRQVELREGPRQLGFCVDGAEARIRVEV